MATVKQLRTLANEMNKIMGLKPKIDTKASKDTLEEEIKDQIEEVQPEDNFTKGSWDVLKELGYSEEESEEEETENEEEETDEEETEEEADEEDETEDEEDEEETEDEEVDEEDEEEPDEEDEEEEEEEEPEPPKKSSKKKAAPKKEAPAKKTASKKSSAKKETDAKEKKAPAKKKQQGEKYTRKHATRDAFLKGGTRDQIIENIDKIFYEKTGKETTGEGAKAHFEHFYPFLKICGLLTEDSKGKITFNAPVTSEATTTKKKKK